MGCWPAISQRPDITAAVEKLEWYALRWKVEVFHKMMKSGCRAEEARFETADRLAKFLALIAVVSWWIFFHTMSAREKPEAEPDPLLVGSRCLEGAVEDDGRVTSVATRTT